MIETENLTKAFGNLKAVENLTIKVENEIFGFLGPNGAGKTTSIKMMTGLLKPSSGSAKICGFDIRNDPISAKKKLALVPKDEDSPLGAIHIEIQSRKLEEIIDWLAPETIDGKPLKGISSKPQVHQ